LASQLPDGKNENPVYARVSPGENGSFRAGQEVNRRAGMPSADSADGPCGQDEITDTGDKDQQDGRHGLDRFRFRCLLG
jgi:hypothetical protein